MTDNTDSIERQAKSLAIALDGLADGGVAISFIQNSNIRIPIIHGQIQKVASQCESLAAACRELLHDEPLATKIENLSNVLVSNFTSVAERKTGYLLGLPAVFESWHQLRWESNRLMLKTHDSGTLNANIIDRASVFEEQLRGLMLLEYEP